jgi:hypothetical protein
MIVSIGVWRDDKQKIDDLNAPSTRDSSRNESKSSGEKLSYSCARDIHVTSVNELVYNHVQSRGDLYVSLGNLVTRHMHSFKKKDK